MKRLFEIPDDNEVIAQLIEAVPLNWSWIDGRLSASAEAISLGGIAPNSGFALQRFHAIHPTIIGKKKDGKMINPDFYSLIVEKKLPEFISFDEAAFETAYEGLTMEVVKNIAIAFVRLNYRGHLCFFSGCCDNYKYDNPAGCSFTLVPWIPAPVLRDEYPLEKYPATVKVEWNKEFGGKEKDVKPILLICENLKEFELTLSS